MKSVKDKNGDTKDPNLQKVFYGCSQCGKIFSIITQPCKIKYYGATSNLTKNIIDLYNN